MFRVREESKVTWLSNRKTGYPLDGGGSVPDYPSPEQLRQRLCGERASDASTHAELLVSQCLQDAIGDVEPWIDVDGFLQNQIELIGFRNLLNGLFSAIFKRRQLFIAT